MTDSSQMERRWIILAEDGRHSTIGRHSDPSDEELAQAAEQLRASGIGGWLAVTEGRYYQPCDPFSVMMVREISPTSEAWETVAKVFKAVRQKTIAPSTSKLRGSEPG